MEAFVTIKATPAEFDVLRRALQTHTESQTDAANELPSGKLKQDCRAESLRASELLGRLK